MEKSSKLLKVTSILMIIFGSIAILMGLLALVAALALDFAAVNIGTDGAEIVGELILVAAITTLIGAAIQFIAGIVGVKNYNKPEKANICIVFAILVALIAIASMAFEMVGGQFGGLQVFSVIIGLCIPVLYFIGALQLKKLAS